MNNVTIKNVSSAKVIINAPDVRFNRELMPGRIISVPEEVYNELQFDSGFQVLIDGHYIKVEGAAVEETQAGVDTTPVYDMQQISKMFDTQDYAGFTKFIQNAAPAEKETVVKLAIEKGITAGGFTALIKKYCDVDIIKAIAMKHDLEDK